MWTYNKTLEYPINIKCTNPKLAKFIISQYGGPDGELAASLRYLSQRFGMPDQKSKAILNDIGTEELAHLEMVGTIVHQLTDGASIEEIEKAGLGAYYTDRGVDVYPQSAGGTPFTAAYIACKGDPIANLQEDLAADVATLMVQQLDFLLIFQHSLLHCSSLCYTFNNTTIKFSSI